MSGARPDTWMPLYVGDYLRDTGRLATEGHGAYLLLIFDYWTSGAALPDDDAQLAAIARLPLLRWKKLRPALAQFFQVADGKWHHKRIDREIAKARGIASERAVAGKVGAEKRWQTHSKRITEPLANASQNDAPSPSSSLRSEETITKEEVPPASLPPKGADAPRRSRGSRLPSEFSVPAEWISEGADLREKHGLPAADLATEAVGFPLFWTAVAGAKGVKTDWRKTWLNRCLQAKSLNGAGLNGRAGHLENGRKLSPVESIYAGAALAIDERERRRQQAQRQPDSGEGDNPPVALLDCRGRA